MKNDPDPERRRRQNVAELAGALLLAAAAAWAVHPAMGVALVGLALLAWANAR